MTCHRDNARVFEGQRGGLIALSVLISPGSGQMLSLEDGTSSGGGQEVEGTKREGPSEYEITLENKNKQVRLVCQVCVCVCVCVCAPWERTVGRREC